jgi:hypothetical protein
LSSAKDDFRVIALLSAYNEGDIISPVLDHLIENGVDVYFLDNHSTDDTLEQVSQRLGRGVIGVEKFPGEVPEDPGPSRFDWGGILRRKEELAGELTADWFIHHDADEIREPPWPGISLRDAIRWVDRLGYNSIDFRVVNFPPNDDGFRQGSDPRTYFRYWEAPGEFDEVQIKAWKKGSATISLAPFGGHEVRFGDRRVFPIRFLLRHYPIRGQAHGERKVFAERKSRFLAKERVRGWHVQYDSWKEGDSFLKDPYHLHLFDDDRIRLELQLENEVATEARARARGLGAEVERLSRELESSREAVRTLEGRFRDLDDRSRTLEFEAVARERVNEELARQLGLQEGRAGALERQLGRLLEVEARLSDAEALARTLTARLEAAHAHAGDLAADRSAIEKEATGLREENARLSGELKRIRGSTIWRWTAPLRRLLDAIRSLGRTPAATDAHWSRDGARSNR